MKELSVTFRVHNNRLLQRRKELGMSQRSLATAAGVSFFTYNGLETLRESPQRSDGSWSPSALKLSEFHGVEAAELFPQSVLSGAPRLATKLVDAADLAPLLSSHQERLLSGPDPEHDRDELRALVQRTVATLPPREAQALRLRFGLDGGDPLSWDDVGIALDVSGTRAAQLVSRALRMLKHPARALCEFVPDDERSADGTWVVRLGDHEFAKPLAIRPSSAEAWAFAKNYVTTHPGTLVKVTRTHKGHQ